LGVRVRDGVSFSFNSAGKLIGMIKKIMIEIAA
jgi:hypothetical protein